jgi:hypothetical protein
VAEPARRSGSPAPPLDPAAVEHAYRLERAKRRARTEHERARRRARRRFLLVLVALLGLAAAFGLNAWQQIQALFGL